MFNDRRAVSVAIIASRESVEVLVRCIKTVLTACPSPTCVIDLVINGNQTLAAEVTNLAPCLDTGTHTLQVWSIPAGDKANAWNEYVHRIWQPGRHAYFVDGYVEVRLKAFTKLLEQMENSADALAATGVPSSGRSASALRAQMIREGGIHGNMHLLHANTMQQLRHIGFRLPLGLYRTDSLVGAVLMYGIDPAKNCWDTKRIAVVADASWDVPGLSELSLKNLVGQFKRRLRQAQGDLENKALRQHISILKQPVNRLPASSQLLVSEWIANYPTQARSIFLKRPMCFYAARKMRAPNHWSGNVIAASLTWRTGDAPSPSINTGK